MVSPLPERFGSGDWEEVRRLGHFLPRKNTCLFNSCHPTRNYTEDSYERQQMMVFLLIIHNESMKHCFWVVITAEGVSYRLVLDQCARGISALAYCGMTTESNILEVS